MITAEGLDDEWVLHSHADTDAYTIASSKYPDAAESGSKQSVNSEDLLGWVLDATNRQNGCQFCTVGLSFDFIFNPYDTPINASTSCTCSRAQAPSPNKGSKSSEANIASTGKESIYMKPIVPLSSLNKMRESVLSPYLVFMEREYFGDFSQAGNQLHVPSRGKFDFGKRFGNTVSQDQLDSVADKLDDMLLKQPSPVEFNYLPDGESLNDSSQVLSFRGDNAKAKKGINRMYHTFNAGDLQHEPYDYSRDEIIGVKGGYYPFDRRPLSASADTAAANANHVQQQKIAALNEVTAGFLAPKHPALGVDQDEKKKKKGAAFHTAAGAMYLEKLHPSMKLYGVDKKKKSKKKSSDKLAWESGKEDPTTADAFRDAGSKGDDYGNEGDDLFNMTATNEAEEEPDEFSSTYKENNSSTIGSVAAAAPTEPDKQTTKETNYRPSFALNLSSQQQELFSVNVKKPKAALGVVRSEWNYTHFCYSNYDNEHNHSKNKHLFEDLKSKRNDEKIRYVLQKKLENGEKLPLQSQQIESLQAIAADCSNASTVLADSASAGQAVVMSRQSQLSNSIFDPTSATRKALAKAKKDLWHLNVERLHNSSVAGNSQLEELFLNDDMNKFVEELSNSQIAQQQALIGSNDPLYIIYKEESMLEAVRQKHQQRQQQRHHNQQQQHEQQPQDLVLIQQPMPPVIRGSELRSLASFHNINPEIWVTARVTYLLLVCYYLLIIKPERDLLLLSKLHGGAGNLEAKIELTGQLKQSRMSIIKDLKSALQQANKIPSSPSQSVAQLAPLIEENNRSALEKPVEKTSTSEQGRNNSKRGKRDSQAKGKQQQQHQQHQLSVASIDKINSPKRMNTTNSTQLLLNDEEYIQTLSRKVDMNDLWERLADQLQPTQQQQMQQRPLSTSAAAGKTPIALLQQSAAAALDEFSWPNLQTLLSLPSHMALVLHIIEYGSDVLPVNIDDDAGNNGNANEEEDNNNGSSTGRGILQPIVERNNKFYMQFPQSLLPTLRKAVQRRVLHPSACEHTSAVAAKLCSWSRRVVGNIYKFKTKESTFSLNVDVDSITQLNDSNSVLSSRKPILPPLRHQIALQSNGSNNDNGASKSSSHKPLADMLSLVNYTSAGRTITNIGNANSGSSNTNSSNRNIGRVNQQNSSSSIILGADSAKATSLTIVSVGFDLFACYHIDASTNNSSNAITIGTLPLHEQYVLDDVMIVGMILARPYDRLDVLIPSPPESLIQQHLKFALPQTISTGNAAAVATTSMQQYYQQQYPHLQFTQQQLIELEHRHAQDELNWAQFENLTHFCKAHIEMQANSPSHRILPAAVAFDVDVAVNEIVEDGVDSAQYVTPHNSNLHAMLVISENGNGHGSGVSGTGAGECADNSSSAVTVGKFTQPNKQHSVTVSLTKAVANRNNPNCNANGKGSAAIGAIASVSSINASAANASGVNSFGVVADSSQSTNPNAHNGKRRISRADIISNLNTFNRLTEHRNHLQTYGDRQVFGATDAIKYAQRNDVQANLIVIGLPSGKGAQQQLQKPIQSKPKNDKVVSNDVNAELLTSLLTNRTQEISLVIACAGISRTPVQSIPDQPHLHAAQSKAIVDIVDKRGPSRFVVAIVDSPASHAAFKLALSLCKPCDIIFLVHIVMVVGHLQQHSDGHKEHSSTATTSTSKQMIHGFNSDAESRASHLADKYKQLGYNLHVERVVLPYDYQLENMTSAEMTEGIPRNRHYFNEQVRKRRLQLAECLLRCVQSFDPTFLFMGADDADMGFAFEVVGERSLAEIEAVRAREQRRYRLNTQSNLSMASNSFTGDQQQLMKGGQLENDNEYIAGGSASSNDDNDAMNDTEEAFEAEVNALASICDEYSLMSNVTSQYQNREDSYSYPLSSSSNARTATAAAAAGAVGTGNSSKIQHRSLVEAVVAIGSDISKRGGKRAVGRSIEKFSIVLTAATL